MGIQETTEWIFKKTNLKNIINVKESKKEYIEKMEGGKGKGHNVIIL